jgi:hypothetical protein
MGRQTTTLREDYFSWLCKLAVPKRPGFLLLSRELHKKKFRWSIHNDDNRCEDGLELRDRYVEENNLDEDHLEVQYFLKGDCTVFEVIVALALRINDLMYDLNHQEDHTAKWFLEMLTNLGLNIFTDGYNLGERYEPVTEAKIDEILETLMDRTYDFYGHGGLFPLKRRPRKDQTEVEIWYQLMGYLDENYGL